MKRKKLLLFAITSMCSVVLLIRLAERIVSGAPTVGPTVKVTAEASTSKGVVHYQWKSTARFKT